MASLDQSYVILIMGMVICWLGWFATLRFFYIAYAFTFAEVYYLKFRLLKRCYYADRLSIFANNSLLFTVGCCILLVHVTYALAFYRTC
jgi:hypothetical protein